MQCVCCTYNILIVLWLYNLRLYLYSYIYPKLMAALRLYILKLYVSLLPHAPLLISIIYITHHNTKGSFSTHRTAPTYFRKYSSAPNPLLFQLDQIWKVSQCVPVSFHICLALWQRGNLQLRIVRHCDQIFLRQFTGMQTIRKMFNSQQTYRWKAVVYLLIITFDGDGITVNSGIPDQSGFY